MAWLLRWFGFNAESGLGEEPIDERGPVLDVLEPVLDDGGQLVRCTRRRSVVIVMAGRA